MADLPSRALVFTCLLIAPALAGARGGCGGQLPLGADAGTAGKAPSSGGNPSSAGGSNGAYGGSSNESGSSGTGNEPGSSGAGAGAQCEDEERAVRRFLDANKACDEDSDCQIEQVGCGVTEDDCTGGVYVNQSTNEDDFVAFRSAYALCVSNGTSDVCASCRRAFLGPACIAGRCQRQPLDAGACGDQKRAVREFLSANKACRDDSECQTRGVGCGVTEDGCTSAVFVNDSTDFDELDSLSRALAQCTSGGEAESCSACLRAVPDGTCLSGLCQNPSVSSVRVIRGDASSAFWNVTIRGEALEQHEGKRVRVRVGMPDRPPERLGSGEAVIESGRFELFLPSAWESDLYKQKLVFIDADADGTCDPARDRVFADFRATYTPELIVTDPPVSTAFRIPESFDPESDCAVFNSSWPSE